MQVLTLQQIFDKASEHLLTQRRLSVTEDRSTCQYRCADGTMCAVGALIKPELYDDSFEGLTVSIAHYRDDDGPVVKLKQALIGSGLDVDDDQTRLLLTFLQGVHDDSNLDELVLSEDELVKMWKTELFATAEHFKLDSSILERF